MPADEGHLAPAWREAAEGRSPWHLASRTAAWLEQIEDGLKRRSCISVSHKLGTRSVGGVPIDYLVPDPTVPTSETGTRTAGAAWGRGRSS